MEKQKQYERLEWLVNELCKESEEHKNLKVISSERRATMRSLMNIRMPRPASSKFLEIQDVFYSRNHWIRGL